MTIEHNDPITPAGPKHDEILISNEDLIVHDGSTEENEVSMKVRFMRRVYSVIAFHVLVAALVSSIGLMQNVKENLDFIWFCLAFILIGGLIVPLLLAKSISKKIPMNIILMVAFTACESFMLIYWVAYFSTPPTFLMCAGLCCAYTIVLALYAWIAKSEIPYRGYFLTLFMTCLIFYCAFSLLVEKPLLHIFYCVLGAFGFGLYLILDTPIIQDRFGIEYSVDDYIIASLDIYMDIGRILLYAFSATYRRNN